MSAAHYENFPVASFLLPRAQRTAIVAIYRFARAADDVADEGDAPPAARLAGLDRFERALDAIAAGRPPSAAPFAALAAAIDHHALPLTPFRDLLSAFRQDVVTHRYASWPALLDYCRRSANPIGRLLLRLHRHDDPAALAWSDAICTALQLVNFWQDIAARLDQGTRLPAAGGPRALRVTEAQIAEGRCDDAWRALVAFETERTRALLESGRPLVRALPWRAGLELAGVLAGGHRILDRIDAVDGDVFRRRPRLSRDRLGAGRLPCACATAPPSRRAGGNDGMSAAGPPQGGSRATTTSAASVGAHA